LAVSSALLFLLGLLMVYNTTSAEIIDRNLDLDIRGAVLKQVGFGAVGVALGLFCYRWGYRKLISHSYLLAGITTALLAAVFIPSVGQTINGSTRWIGALGYTIGQPSELAKIFLPAAYIQWACQQEGEIELKRFVRALALFAIPIGLVLAEPDTGTTLLLLTLGATLFWLTRVKLAYWLIPLACLLCVGGAAAFQMPHVRARIEVFLHPELDLRGKGHQPYQAKIAAGSGQITGRGLGQSLQKLNYLPEARSDYIAAIFAEETGFVGMVLMIGLYLTIALSGVGIAFRAHDREGFYLASILTVLIALQAFVNLGVVSGLLPSKGMTLPFFSQGGSSLIVNLMAVFLLLDISRSSTERVRHGAASRRVQRGVDGA
jgi:cell division protein FtsW